MDLSLSIVGVSNRTVGDGKLIWCEPNVGHWIPNEALAAEDLFDIGHLA